MGKAYFGYAIDLAALVAYTLVALCQLGKSLGTCGASASALGLQQQQSTTPGDSHQLDDLQVCLMYVDSISALGRTHWGVVKQLDGDAPREFQVVLWAGCFTAFQAEIHLIGHLCPGQSECQLEYHI